MEEEYSTSELVALAEKHLAHNYAWMKEMIFVRGEGCRLYDLDGKEYFDFLSCYSALNVGHTHPAIMAAAREQIGQLTACSRKFLTKETVLFAKELAEFCGMDKVLPMNTGAEAVETAMKMSRKWGERKKEIPSGLVDLCFCWGNFHGRTLGVISASTNFQYRDGFGPFLPGIKIISYGHAQALEEAITPNTAAFFVEPIQGEGGINIPPAGYLTLVRKVCDEHNVLMVVDEVQTGFGRTGTMFACDREGVKPDLYILGKALGGGFPISAVVGDDRVINVFNPGDHGSTFGGNPFSCHVARAAMRVLQEENLDKAARKLGGYFLLCLDDLKKRCRIIKEVRGMGLFIGVELEKEGPSILEVTRALCRAGVLCDKAGERVVRFSPPLNITYQELDAGFAIIEKVFLQRESKRRKQ